VGEKRNAHNNLIGKTEGKIPLSKRRLNLYKLNKELWQILACRLMALRIP
jgi:hypothetical protein